MSSERPGSASSTRSGRRILMKRSSDPALNENRRNHAFSLWPRPSSPHGTHTAKAMTSLQHPAIPAASNPHHLRTTQNIQEGASESPAISPRTESPEHTFAGGMLGFKPSRKKTAAAAESGQDRSAAPSQAPTSSRVSLQPRSASVETVQLREPAPPRTTAPNPTPSAPSIHSAPPPARSTTARSSVSQQQAAQARFNSVSSEATTPDSRDHGSTVGSIDTYETDATSIHTLPALQAKGPAYELGALEPVPEDDPTSYDLIAPPTQQQQRGPSYSLEARGEELFSTEHLRAIFDDPAALLKFTSFLGTHRPESVPILIYYLDALKALRAIKYSNAVSEALEPLEGHIFTEQSPAPTRNPVLEEKARLAFGAMVDEDLPAFVTHTWIAVVSASIHRRITGTLPPHLREASEGLAEVFCLSDPSRPDNPIVFASEEFHRVTQYGNSYAMGRNCRFLQGPRTNKSSVRRLRDACVAGKEHCEVFINYRRDGSPFMNLLMIAPLRDSRGTLRYYVGAQVDVSGLAKECAELEALQKLLGEKANGPRYEDENERKDEFQELSEMLNISELEIVRKHGGAMHREHAEENDDNGTTWHRPRLLLKDPSAERIEVDHRYEEERRPQEPQRSTVHGKLSGVYQHYLLVRPYPSLRILFASPSLRVPGILQSPFMNRIGGSERVQDELVAALAEGRGVTAKVRWISRPEDEGRNRWVHCTPLMGSNGNIGVWMVVLVDDENSRAVRRFRPAPPVANEIGGKQYDAHRHGHQIRTGKETRPGTAAGHRPDTAMSGREGRNGSYSRQDGSFDFTLN